MERMRAKLNLEKLIIPKEQDPVKHVKIPSDRVDVLLNQIKETPSPKLQVDGNPPTYSDMQKIESHIHAGFNINDAIDDVFIHVERSDKEY